MTTTIDIVTGASQGIGRAIAESIAHHRSASGVEKSSYKLVLLGRNEQRGQQAASKIQQETGLSVVFESVDVSNYRQVQALKDKIVSWSCSANSDRAVVVGILVNSAAECPQRQQLVQLPRNKGQSSSTQPDTTTVDRQFATNVLGYHFMLSTFEKYMEKSHVVMIASNWAGDLDLSDLHFQRRTYDNDSAYRQSKQCNRMLTREWAKRLQHSRNSTTLVNACHPGDPCTTLSKHLGYNLHASAPSRQMVDSSTPLPFLCGFGNSSSRKINVTGRWFDGYGTEPTRCRFADMEDEAAKLFDICQSYCV
jgi:NAD(P)-dependent dehydrogenase (short-subunit alcohol dehydrogenase family)